MNIKKQLEFIESLNQKMAENGEDGISFFKQEWPKLDHYDRKAVASLIGVGVGVVLGAGDGTFEYQLSWLAIVNYAEMPIVDGEIVEDYPDEIFPKLVLRDDVNGNQITKVFHDLYRKGVIKSSLNLIAEAISIIFQIEESTAYKDLSEKERLVKVIPLLP